VKAPAPLLRALDTADPAIRFFLFYGPDEATSRALAARLGSALGADAERIDLSSAALRADPARLADEAAAISLFGGRRWIRIDPATDEATDAVAALLEAPAAGNPVAAVAGALRKDARLVKLAGASRAAMAQASYLPEGRDADAVAVEIGRALGVQLRPDMAARVARSVGNDRALITRELEKYALFLDAAPERPKPLEADAFEALGASAEEGDLSRLVGAVFGGRVAQADAELARLGGEGVEGIPVLRALLRRGLQLAEWRAQVAEGNAVDVVIERAGRQIFWKEKDATADQLRRWRPDALATAIGRLADAERQLKAGGTAGPVLVAQEVLAIARFAGRG